MRRKYGPLIGLPVSNSASNFAGSAWTLVHDRAVLFDGAHADAIVVVLHTHEQALGQHVVIEHHALRSDEGPCATYSIVSPLQPGHHSGGIPPLYAPRNFAAPTVSPAFSTLIGPRKRNVPLAFKMRAGRRLSREISYLSFALGTFGVYRPA